MSSTKGIGYQISYLIENAKANAVKEFPEMKENDILKVSLLMLKQARSVIPMYTGNLNPDWNLYNETVNFLEQLIKR